MSGVDPGQGRFRRVPPRSGDTRRRPSRNEKVRGSNPLSSTKPKPRLTCTNVPDQAGFRHCHSASFSLGAPPRAPRGLSKRVQTVQTGPVGRGSEVVCVDVRSRQRGVSHPGLNGGYVDTACERLAVWDATPRTSGLADLIVDTSQCDPAVAARLIDVPVRYQASSPVTATALRYDSLEHVLTLRAGCQPLCERRPDGRGRTTQDPGDLGPDAAAHRSGQAAGGPAGRRLPEVVERARAARPGGPGSSGEPSRSH
jgi:hypothetical protein